MKIFIILFFCYNSNYAENDSIQKINSKYSNLTFASTKKESSSETNKNLFKVSFPLLNQPAISFQYERNIYKKISTGLSVNFVSEQEFLLLKMITEQRVSNEFAQKQLRNIKTKIFSLSPEARIYFGKEPYKGFYLGPFVRFSNYNVHFPLEYLENEMEEHYQKVTFSGKFNTVTFGLSIGAQWKVYKNFYLDWLIIGPHLGNATEHLNLNSNLSYNQQKGIRKSLDMIKESITKIDDIPDINFDYEVNENGGTVTIKNPWAGMRFQLGIGYRF